MTLAMVGNGNRTINAALLIAGVLVLGAGTYLWHILHAGNFGDTEGMLAAGAVSAVVALALQCVFIVPELFGKPPLAGKSFFGGRSLLVQRIAAVLLTLSALAVAASKYI
jgi:hypothetical protein